MRIGIPGGLFYFKYYPLWKTFFEELGCEVISVSTNRRIMDSGVSLCVDEACLPVKIYHGHVDSLNGNVDAMFIPRIVSISRYEYICPKFCGLPEMIKNSIHVTSEIIDTTINLRQYRSSLLDSVMETGSFITHNRYSIMNAFKSALNVQSGFEERLKLWGDFNKALNNNLKWEEPGNKRIAVIGHPYIIYDSYINMDILKKISCQGYSVITPQMVEREVIDRYASLLPKRHFWTLGRETLGAGLSFLDRSDIMGIIYVSSFCCGIDSLIEDYLERHIMRRGNMPYMKLVLDEHSGEAGFDTRLEAFLDMIRWREDNESHISSHGGSIYSR